MEPFCNANGSSGILVSNGGKAKSKKCFLKIETEMVEQVESGRRFKETGQE